jgi:hypothetical protein
MSHVAALLGDILQVRGDGVIDPLLDDAIHLVPKRNTDVCGVHQHMVKEGVAPEGEQYVVVPPGVVRGGEVQRDQN